MSMTRRQLLWSSAAATLALTLPGARRKARAASASSPKNLIIVFAYGGWDTSYAIDPKAAGGAVDVPDQQTGSSPTATIQTYGQIDALVDPSWASVGTFFSAYGAQTAVVRGIRLPGISHRACSQQILTGARNETSPDAAAIVAHANGADLPIPYLVLGDAAFAGPYAATMGRVGASNQLAGLLDPRHPYPIDGITDLPFSPAKADEDTIRAYTLARANRERAVRGATGYNKARVDDFVTSLARGDQLRNLASELGTRNTAIDLDAQRSLAVNALKSGLSRTVMLSSMQSWDTHENNFHQAASHAFLFDKLTALLDLLRTTSGATAGHTLLDETVVAVISEMGRTPKRNVPALGKDHWPVTSA